MTIGIIMIANASAIAAQRMQMLRRLKAAFKLKAARPSASKTSMASSSHLFD